MNKSIHDPIGWLLKRFGLLMLCELAVPLLVVTARWIV